MSDSFTPKLGRIGWKQGTRLDRYINRVMRAAHQLAIDRVARNSSFTGQRWAGAAPLGHLRPQASIPVASAASSSRPDHQVEGG